MTNVPGGSRRAPRRSRLVAAAFLAALTAGVLFSAPASAQLLPPLPTSSPGLDLDETIGDVTDAVTDVPDQLGSILDETTASLTIPTKPKPKPRTNGVVPQTPLTDTWSTEIPAGLRSTTATVAPRVSQRAYRRSLSYGAAVSDGFRNAMSRAAGLAGPLAAPMALALVAVGLIAIAARGPGRLAKVEEERQILRERRAYRL